MRSKLVMHIQKIVRGKRGRKLKIARVLFLEQMRLIEEEKQRVEKIKFDAATKIQNLGRRKVALAQVAIMVVQQRTKAASFIQKCTRGSNDRVKVKEMIRKETIKQVQAEKEKRGE